MRGRSTSRSWPAETLANGRGLILLATGILTISFSGGMPQFSINRQRAEEIHREVTTQTTQAASQWQRSESTPRR